MAKAAAPAEAAAAQSSGAGDVGTLEEYRFLLGEWVGELSYLDYQDNKTQVVLPVAATVTEGDISRLAGKVAAAVGQPGLIFALVFTEPSGAKVKGESALAPLGSDGGFFYDGTLWQVESREVAGEAAGQRIRLVLVAPGMDDNRPALVRVTLDASPDSLSAAKAIRYQGSDAEIIRNTLRLQRP